MNQNQIFATLVRGQTYMLLAGEGEAPKVFTHGVPQKISRDILQRLHGATDVVSVSDPEAAGGMIHRQEPKFRFDGLLEEEEAVI